MIQEADRASGHPRAPGSRSDPAITIERVLIAVEQVPSGRLVTYGDLAGLVGTSARRVGVVLKLHGGAVPWWRVTNARGELPAPLLAEAREHWSAEGISLAASGCGCRIAAHRADLIALGAAYDHALAESTEGPPCVG